MFIIYAFGNLKSVLEWSTSCSSQAEILEYMRSVAKKYDIFKHTHLSTEVVKATWLTDKCKWQLDVKTKGQEDIRSLYFDVL